MGIGYTWTETTPLPTVMSNSYSIATNNRVWVAGGLNAAANAVVNTVYTAPVNPDGTIGNWVTCNPYNTGRISHKIVIARGYIFLVGGSNFAGTQFYPDIQSAKILDDGTLGPWQWSGISPNNWGFHTCITFVYNDFLYIGGGFARDTAGAGASIRPTGLWRASVNVDGTLAPWQSIGTIAPGNLTGAQSASSARFQGVLANGQIPYTSFTNSMIFVTPLSVGEYAGAPINTGYSNSGAFLPYNNSILFPDLGITLITAPIGQYSQKIVNGQPYNTTVATTSFCTAGNIIIGMGGGSTPVANVRVKLLGPNGEL